MTAQHTLFMLWQSYYKTIIINDIIVFLLCNREFLITQNKAFVFINNLL